MLEIFIVAIVACAAGITGFVYGLRHRKVIEKDVKDSYTVYLEELVQNGTHQYNPHAVFAFNKAFDEATAQLSKKIEKDMAEKEFVYRDPLEKNNKNIEKKI